MKATISPRSSVADACKVLNLVAWLWQYNQEVFDRRRLHLHYPAQVRRPWVQPALLEFVHPLHLIDEVNHAFSLDYATKGPKIRSTTCRKQDVVIAFREHRTPKIQIRLLFRQIEGVARRRDHLLALLLQDGIEDLVTCGWLQPRKVLRDQWRNLRR